MPIPCPPVKLSPQDHIRYFREELAKWRAEHGGSTAIATEEQTHISDLSGEELQRMAEQKKESDQNIDEEVLGKEAAKRYKLLLRRENSMDPSISAAASAEREKMEDSLTESQRNRLHGIGDQGLSHESLSDIADAVQRIENAHDPSDIVQALKFQIPYLDNGPETQSGVKALAAFKAAARTIKENGWDSKEIQGDLARDFAARFSDPADAAYILERVFPNITKSGKPTPTFSASESKRITERTETTPSAPEPEKPVATSPQDSDFSDRLKTHLGEGASKWKEGDIENARKYVEDGDEDAYRALSSIKQSAVTRFAASDAPERARQGEAKARELAGKTITTESGITYKPQEGYSATEGQGDGLTDLVEDKEDPETGLKTVFSVANPSQEKPEPTEENLNRYAVGDRGKALVEISQKAAQDFEKKNPWIKGKIFVHPNKESLREIIRTGSPQAKASAQDALDLLDKGSPVAGYLAKDGSIHIYPQNAPDTEAGVKRLIEHEIFHRGEEFSRVYAPKEYNRLQKLKAQLDDQQLARLGDGKYSPIYGDWRTNPESRIGLQTEWITDQIEKGALEKASPDSVLGRIWQTLKDIYSRLTGNKTPTDQQIKDMYRAMAKVQEDGKPHPKAPLGETKFSDFKAGQGTTENDRAYNTAVREGDMASAQKLVDEAAKSAGYTEGVSHGTVSDKAFTVFRSPEKGIWTAFDTNNAQPGSGESSTRVMRLKADPGKNPLTLKESDIEEWRHSPNPLKWMRDFKAFKYAQKGYGEIGAEGKPTSVRIGDYALVVFKPEQLKSSEPITRDSKGAMIPLGERFKSQNKDIRYSLSDFKAGIAHQVGLSTEQIADNAKKTTEEVKDVARGIIDTVKSVIAKAREIPAYTEAKKVVGTMKKGLVQDEAVIKSRVKTFIKDVPLRSRRDAINIWRQAAGDEATLKKWATDTKHINPRLSKAAEVAQDLSPKEQNWGDQLSDWYEELGALGVEKALLPEEVMKEGSQTYANAIWKKKITAAGRDAYNQFVGKLQRNFNFGKRASFENFYEGAMAGLEPKTLDAADLYSAYHNHMSKVIHSNEFVKNMMAAKTQEGLPMAVIKGVDITGENTGKYKIIDSTLAKRILDQGDQVPYKSSPDPRLWGWKFMGQDTAGKDVMMKGNLAFHPEGFKIVDNMLRRSALKDWAESPSESAVAELAKKAFTVADTLNSGVKAGMFGFSPFHMVQEGTQALGHRFNPLTDLKDFDPANATHLDAVQHGLVLPGMEGQDNDMFEGLTSGGWMHRIPGVGPLAKAVSDNTWKYVRSLKLKGYETVLDANRKTFAGDIAKGKVSDADVKHLSATQMNESFGGLNYQMMGRNPTIQHLMRLSLLAPDFLEARFRASSSALAGLTGAKAGKEQAVALATLAMGSYAIARVLNGILNDGDTKPDHPFSVISGNREYTMRSLPEDMWKAATNTREFAMGRLSPLIARTAIQLATGRNYRGEAVPASETMKEAALAGVPMSMRQIPGLRELTQTSANNPVSPLEGALSTFGLHISKFSPIVSGYELSSQFKQQIGKPDTGAYPVSPYTPLKNALEDVDMDEAQKQLAKLRQTIPKDKLAKAVHASIFHSWMDSSDEEKAFLKSLTPENKATLKAAETRRKDLWRRWLRISGGLGGDLPVGTPTPK